MEITDLSKDIRRLLLDNWNEEEINSRLRDPEYFFEQIVIPRLDYLRRQGEEIPRLRLQKTPKGQYRVIIS